jgi:DNA-binding NtrC family response regulator
MDNNLFANRVVMWIADQAPSDKVFLNPEDSETIEIIPVTRFAVALELLRGRNLDAILVRLPLADCNAEELLGAIRELRTDLPVVLHEPSTIRRSEAECQRLGIARYIANAVPPYYLGQALLDVMNGEVEKASEESRPGPRDSGIMVGSSASMRQVSEIIKLIGPRRCTILITGDTGSGKEVAARAIHAASNRCQRRMVAVNCAALPDNLLEAELFGHTKGAFTGAVNARVGLFEQAHRSTIFLDEISELPMSLQAKLLRVLQEREIQRIGSSRPVPVDVRVIAASNTNLLEAVANQRFREDLYYRLNVVALQIPALRERATDVPELADYFLARIADQEGGPAKTLSPEALAALVRYSWPGNVRQLEHALESAVALSGSRTVLYPGDFVLPLRPHLSGISGLDVPETGIDFEELIANIERRLLERALARSGGNKSRAADLLKMKRTTLISKFKALEVCA